MSGRAGSLMKPESDRSSAAIEVDYSFGCRVCLEAVCEPATSPNPDFPGTLCK